MDERDDQMVKFLEAVTGNPVDKEFELDKHAVYNADGDLILEETFVINLTYLDQIYKELFGTKYQSLKDFVETYDSEEDGIALYNRAKNDNMIVEEHSYHYADKPDLDRLGIITLNLIMEIQEKTFSMNNEELKKYLKSEIGLTESEWLFFEPQLKLEK